MQEESDAMFQSFGDVSGSLHGYLLSQKITTDSAMSEAAALSKFERGG